MSPDIVFGIVLGALCGALSLALIIQICEKTAVVLTGSESGLKYVIRKSNIRSCQEVGDSETLVTLKEPIALVNQKTTTQMFVREEFNKIIR